MFRGRKNTKSDEINHTFSGDNLKLNISLEDQDSDLKDQYSVSGVIVKGSDFKFYGSL